MNRLLLISSYLLAIALGAGAGIALYSHHASKPSGVPYGNGVCAPVIVSAFGDTDLHLDQVCSDEDLARIYGETRLLEKRWTEDHDCDNGDEDSPEVWHMRFRR